MVALPGLLIGRVGSRNASLLLGGGIPLQVAEKDVGGVGRRHREVGILCLHDCGVRRLSPGVADVVEGDFDGVGC